MLPFEGLVVYHKSLEIVNNIYALTSKWPRTEAYGLTDQARRAAVSIVLNIAEGSSRTKKDFRHFLVMARGSCYELIAILQIAVKRNYLSATEYQQNYGSISTLVRIINGLKKSLKA